jgi:hypothetical protein
LRRTQQLLLAFVIFAGIMAVIQKARAEDKPLAVCKDGICVMAEADYKRLQDMVAEIYAKTEHNNKVEIEMGSESDALRGALEMCKERQKQWKTKWE